MILNWYETLLYGLVSGLSEILPVSSQAHRFLLLRFFGGNTEPQLLRLMTDLGILAALYYACQNHLIRMIRAKRLSKVPKRRRKRPLDTRSLMDLSLLFTMAIPIILAFFVYDKIKMIGSSLIGNSVFLLLNGIILYVPQFLPGGNRDSRNMSRLHGLGIGLGGAVSLLPGLSTVGLGLSVSSVCGVDKKYGFGVTLLMDLLVCAGYVVFDIMDIVRIGLNNVSFGEFALYLLSGAIAFAVATGTIRVFRTIAEEFGFHIFAFYCWGIALFAFIINLVA